MLGSILNEFGITIELVKGCEGNFSSFTEARYAWYSAEIAESEGVSPIMVPPA